MATKITTDPNTLKKQLAGVSVRCALLMMIQKYRMKNKSFFVDTRSFTVFNALVELDDRTLDEPCGRLDILFYGGPPKAGKWYNGTVLTMLCDAMLFDSATQDVPFPERIWMA